MTFKVELRQLCATAAIAAALGFAAPAFAQDVTLAHAQGETVISGQPERVFVVDWAAFDNLSALGVPVAGLPGDNAPAYLADQIPADAVAIGSLFEPDFETIAAEAPDLVIVAARSAATYPTMSSIAPTIDTSISNLDLIAGVEQRLTEYGQIFGVEDKAAELVANLEAKLAEARALAEGNGTGLVIVTNAGNIGVYGPDSRVAWIYNSLNIPSVFDTVDDSDHGGDGISFEYLVEHNPDWLFVVDRDAGVGEAGAAAALLDNELLAGTTFAQNGQIVYLDPQAAYITMHGYQGIMMLLDQIIAGYNAAE